MSQARADLNKQLVSLLPDSIVDLYEIDFSSVQTDFEQLKDLYNINIGSESVYRFCPAQNGNNPIVWQGYSYQPLPIQVEGFEFKSNGSLPRPTLAIANPEGMFSKILRANQDFANCKVTRKRTYVGFLDEINFPGGVNPFGSSQVDSHLPDDVFFINNKKIENKEFIQFELVSALELQNTLVPARTIFSNYCGFSYRCSIGCGYKGLPIETSSGQSLIQGFAVDKERINNSDHFDSGKVDPFNYGSTSGSIDKIPGWNKNGKENTYGYELGDLVKIVPDNANNPYKSTPMVFVCVQKHQNPEKHHPVFSEKYWAKDSCPKTIESCKKRFSLRVDPVTGEDLTPYNESSKSKGLRFGGFPGTERYPIE